MRKHPFRPIMAGKSVFQEEMARKVEMEGGKVYRFQPIATNRTDGMRFDWLAEDELPECVYDGLSEDETRLLALARLRRRMMP